MRATGYLRALYIVYFNLKKGVSQEEFATELKGFSDYFRGKIDCARNSERTIDKMRARPCRNTS